MQASQNVLISSKDEGVYYFAIEKTVVEEKDASGEKEKQPNPDPINWFGLLVPPPLRDAQKHFTAAVALSIPQTINLAGDLRQLETEIGRTRKAIKKLEKSTNSIMPPAASAE
jgi:hypothetical protein